MLLKGRFEVGESLSSRTRLAVDRRTGKKVVVKELSLQQLSSWEGLERFEAEAKTLESVRHPSIPFFVTSFVLDEESPDPRFFLVREFINGTPLGALVGQRLPQDRIDGLTRTLLASLGEIHNLTPPLIHGDLRPDRILETTSGRLIFVGFGFSSAVHSEDYSGFLAPERIANPATIQSDLYSVGAILWTLSSGEPPEQLHHRQGKPELDPNLPTGFQRLLDRLLALEPTDRPATAEAALEIFETPMALSFPREQALAHPRRAPVSRTAGLAAASALIEIALAMIAPGAALAMAPPLLVVLLLSYWSEQRKTETKKDDETS